MKINVGVLRGGFGPEYDISLKSGGAVLANLPRDKYQPVDILLGKDGQWHMDGAPIDPEDLKLAVDVIINSLHGAYGEDGLVQELLNKYNIPYTGGDSLSSRMSFNKALAKEKFKNLGFKTPTHEIVSLPKKMEGDLADAFLNIVEDGAAKVFSKVSPPWVIKPLSSGYSINTYFANDMESLAAAIANVLMKHDHALVEQHIKGREVIVGVIEGFREKEQYSLLPLEVIKTKEILDFDSKINKDYKLVPLSGLSMDERLKLAEIAALIHENFELENYSLVDLILSKNGTYILEVDSMPGFSEHSDFPEMYKAVGADMGQVLDCVIKKTLQRKNLSI